MADPTKRLPKLPVERALKVIAGRWKPIILYYLLGGPKRYGELKRLIPAITEKMLIQHLKQLQEDNLINRKAADIVPPHVVYSLTPSGEELEPVLQAMADWAIKDNAKYAGFTASADAGINAK